MLSKIIYTALLSLLLIHNTFSQWIQSDGPYGSIHISAVFAHNNQLYATTTCGLHTADGTSLRWSLKATYAIDAYDLEGDILYFGAPNMGIQRVDLSGQSFTSTNNGLDGAHVTAIKNGGTCLYAGVENQGFYKSTGYTNNGNFYNAGLPVRTIQLPPSQGGGTLSRRHVSSIETIGNFLFCGTHRGVYRSDATTIAWTALTNGLPADSVQVIKEIDNILYACIGNDLFSSTDNGNQWIRLYEAASMISSIHKAANDLYITTYGSGVYRSVNNGATWETHNQGLADLTVTTITSIGTTLICGTMSGGIFISNGGNWFSSSKGIICSTIMSMVSTVRSIVTNDEGNVFTLSAAAYSWANISPPVSKWYFGSVANMGETIFLSYKDNNRQSVIKYKMPGSTAWNDLAGPMPYAGDDASRMGTLGNTLYVYEDDKLNYTSNRGASWANLSIPSPYCNNFTDFEIFKGTPFAVSCGNGELLKLSSNNTWQLSNAGLPTNRKVTSLAYSSDAIYAHVEGNGIYVSKDEGQTWTLATQGFFTGSGIHSHAYRNHNIFITSAKSVYFSSDYGQQWTSIGQGLPNTTIGPMVIYNDTLFVGTHGNGIWKREIASLITTMPDSAGAMKRIDIFPNPASTYVRFEFEEFDQAKIELIDILGRKLITTTLKEDKQISVAHLVSGTYIIVITTEKYVYNSVLIVAR